jgi:beta-galactosidase
LGSAELGETAPGFPEQVTDIPVGQPCAKLHFLHGATCVGLDGTVVARYRVHYTDGSTHEISVVYGRDLRNWQFWPNMPEVERAGGVVAWQGPQQRWATNYPNAGVRLYRLTWENPHPAKTIAAIDLVSGMEKPAVFVLAITVQP